VPQKIKRKAEKIGDVLRGDGKTGNNPSDQLQRLSSKRLSLKGLI
jgi:hypothetical protein